MSTKTFTLSDELHDYLFRNSVREPEILSRLREETAQMPHGGMQISPEQGQFMRLLVELIGAKRVLEVGVFTGYSSTSVALALPDDGRIVACDVSEEFTGVARRYWQEAGVAHKIDLRLGPATETLRKMVDAGEADAFDFAFIDADKPNYDAYYEHALVLVRPGGLIGIDNTLWSGKVADPAIEDESTLRIRELNAKFYRDERITLSLVPIGDGLTLARKRP
jgi:predicted O-methyltransferase YrrM